MRSGSLRSHFTDRPWPPLVALAALQVAGTAVAASVLTRNGWLWTNAGDQVTYAANGWLLGRLHLPPAELGYGWPLLLAPITWATGSTWLEQAPLAVVANVLVLGPLALACVYGIALHIAGRRFALWAAAAWVAAPFVAVGFWMDEVRALYVDEALPQAIGLTGLAGYPSLVALAAAAWLVLRAVDGRTPATAALAGLVAGLAAGIAPASLLFLTGAALAFLLAQRWREAGAFAAAVVPAVLTIALWRIRGSGSLDVHLAFDWDAWTQQMSELREFSIGARLAQWAPLAGLVAVLLLRRLAAAALLAGWLGAMLAVQGTRPGSSIEAGTFVPLLLPAMPAYVVLVAAVPLLVPTLVRRLGIRPPEAPVARPRRGALAVAALLLAGVPLAVVLAARPLDGPGLALVQSSGGAQTVLPVTREVTARAEARGDAVRVTWDDRAGWHSTVWYRVLRTVVAEPDVRCEEEGVTRCRLTTVPLGETQGRDLVDPDPRPGATYRVAALTNAAAAPSLPAGVVAVSLPAASPP